MKQHHSTLTTSFAALRPGDRVRYFTGETMVIGRRIGPCQWTIRPPIAVIIWRWLGAMSS